MNGADADQTANTVAVPEGGGCRTFDEGSEKSGDDGFADEPGEELELKTGQRFDSALVAGS